MRFRQKTKIVRYLDLGTRRPLRRQTPPHRADGILDGSSHREHGPSSETGPCSHEVGKTLLGGEGHQLLGSFLKDRSVAAKLVKDTVDVQSERQCMKAATARAPKPARIGFSPAPDPLVLAAEASRRRSSRSNADVEGRQLRGSVLSLIIEVERLPQMVERTTEFGAKQMADAQGPVRDQLGVAVISVFGKHR